MNDIEPVTELVATPDQPALFTEDTPVEVWEEHGRKLAVVDTHLPWAIADYLAFGNDTYHDALARAVDIFPQMSPNRMGRLLNLAIVFPPERRTHELSSSFYMEVMTIDDDDQDELLAIAEEQRWTRDELRAEVKVRKALGKPAPNRLPLDPKRERKLETSRWFHQYLRSLDDDIDTVTVPRTEFEALADFVPIEI